MLLFSSNISSNLTESLESAVTPDDTRLQLWRGAVLGPSLPVQNVGVGGQQIDQQGLTLIEGFEGYSYHAYWDIYGGVWTVGYGETSGVGPGTTMTLAQAQADLRDRLASGYEPAVRGLGIPLNQHQFDALCSFVWNLGPGSMESSWTIGRLLRERNYLGAANSMLNYVTAGGVVLQGLVNRREAERRLFLTPVGPPPPPPDPHHYKRFSTDVFKDIGVHQSECWCVKRYDVLRKHGVINRRKLKPVRADLTKLADRVAKVSGAGTKHTTWGEDWRGWRYQELLARSRGEEVWT
jgi:GH24 family phage-related lysozyme (muramidase)